ncbi:hydrolase [Halomonas cupida]|uniref:Hydrolase n=1 Tax=Halomonas cupida TaxID=44933 RepID=A0A1M7HY68_9GAMM|nr:amidohydrolase [Halomonas cupida]GEN23940.1 hydrolase [Halomonas cupida]SHM33319.1 hippurate hydrolase [Halomonas cupida]
MQEQEAERMIAFRQELHRYPELSCEEQHTARRIATMLREIGVDEVHEAIGGHGIVAIIHGHQPGATVGLRADMDALPLHEATGLAHGSTHANVMHACGHDGHTAMLMGATLNLVKARPPQGRVVLVFQPAEELGTGAPSMLEDGLLERFPMQAIFGLHNWPGVEAGSFVIHDVPHMASSDDFEACFHSEGGHGAMPHLTTDPIVAAGLFVTAIQQIVSRNVAPEDIAVVSLGCLQSGHASNIIPASAILKGTARCFKPDVRHQLERRIREVAEGVARASGCGVTLDYVPSTPAVVNDADCARLCRKVVEECWGHNRLVTHPISMGADDMGFLLEAIPGAYGWIGNGKGDTVPDLHQPDYDFNDDILAQGSDFLSNVALRFLDEHHQQPASTTTTRY